MYNAFILCLYTSKYTFEYLFLCLSIMLQVKCKAIKKNSTGYKQLEMSNGFLFKVL